MAIENSPRSTTGPTGRQQLASRLAEVTRQLDKAEKEIYWRGKHIEQLKREKSFARRIGAGVVAVTVAASIATYDYTLEKGEAVVGKNGDAATAVCSVAEQQVESLPFAGNDSFNTEACLDDLQGVNLPEGTTVEVATTFTPLAGVGDGKHVQIFSFNVETGLDNTKIPRN